MLSSVLQQVMHAAQAQIWQLAMLQTSALLTDCLLLMQPFYSTENITKLVKIAEAKVKQLSGEGDLALLPTLEWLGEMLLVKQSVNTLALDAGESDPGVQLLQSGRSQEFGLVRYHPS